MEVLVLLFSLDVNSGLSLRNVPTRGILAEERRTGVEGEEKDCTRGRLRGEGKDGEEEEEVMLVF